MPQSQYSLRSKDVQEVLSTPPRNIIFWGNVIILSSFIAFIILLNNIQTPVKLKFEGDITAIDVTEDETIVSVFINSFPKKKLLIGKEVKLLRDRNLPTSALLGVITELNDKNRTILIRIKQKEDASRFAMSKTPNFIKNGEVITIDVLIDTVSALNLFKTRLINEFNR